MDATKVIVHVAQGDRWSVIFKLFREGVCQPSKAAGLHPQGEVLPLRKLVEMCFDRDFLQRAVLSRRCTLPGLYRFSPAGSAP
jgi:hypothetical protein